ncbi:multidrug and toxin extrusion protein 2-like [Pyxicephalus adspersus]|uniref:multidrug and toxin extrusion protein 2-like n=1 Tax=Pyxicephalus adspersus TaxID=30357 RepID=UPI003B5901F2
MYYEIYQAVDKYIYASCFSVLGCLFVSSTVLSLRNVISYLFTTDREIHPLVSKLMLILAPFHLCDGTNAVCGGIFRGTGKQKIGAITNIFGYYLIGIPVGLSLMFVAKLGVIGLWIGMFCPVLLQTCIYIPYILRMNWHEACEEARVKAGVKQQKVPEPGISQTDVMKSDFDLENGDTTASDSNFNFIVLHDMASEEDYTKQLELTKDLPKETRNVVGEILSTKQLIIRRGLALLLSISVLIIGIIIKLTTTKR